MVTVNAPPEPVIAAPAAACPAEALAFDGGQLARRRRRDRALRLELRRRRRRRGRRGHARLRSTRPATRSRCLADDGSGLDNSRQQTHPRSPRQPPAAAEAGPDRAVCPGEAVAFDGAASNDWDGALVRYAWDFGDGTTADGAQVVHSFAQPGAYQVRLSVTDDFRRALRHGHRHRAGARQRAAGRGRRRRSRGLRRRRPRPAAVRRLGVDRCRRPAAELPVGSRRRRDANRREGPARLRRAGRVRGAARRRDGTGLACGQTSDEIKVDVRNRDQAQEQAQR